MSGAAYIRYVVILAELHGLEVQGWDETLKAAALRDESDALWSAMSEYERTAATNISAAMADQVASVQNNGAA